MMNVKFGRQGKDLSTKMEFITIFTNSSVAMDFPSSITCTFAVAYIYTLM
jgi:hypothetical protein